MLVRLYAGEIIMGRITEDDVPAKLKARVHKYLVDMGYHLKAISGGGSTVYGWVNAADISTGSTGTTTSYRVRTTADVLNIRKGPGTNYGVAGQIKGKGIYTIVAEAAGPGATKWGKLKSGAGWISLDYVTKL